MKQNFVKTNLSIAPGQSVRIPAGMLGTLPGMGKVHTLLHP